MKILITGANGFLGKNLLKKLDNDSFKVLLVVKSIKYYQKNILVIEDNIGQLKKKNLNVIKKFKPEIIINLAWTGIPNYSFRNSIINFFNHFKFISTLCELKSVKKIIMTGSCWEYSPNSGNCKETDRVIPRNEFTWSKISLLNELRRITKLNKINFIWLRIFFMYGKFQKKKSLIPYIIKSLKNNKKPKIENPSNKNDFIHVDDVCDIIISFINKNKVSGIFNVGSGKLNSVIEIYNKILKKLKLIKNKKYQIIKKKEKRYRYNRADIKKIVNHTKYRQKINIDDGINRLLEL